MPRGMNGSKTDPEFRDFTMTPPELFSWLNAQYDFGIDLCAADDSALCDVYYTVNNSCLNPDEDWLTECAVGKYGRWAYCNPPYSDPKPFLCAGIAQAKKGLGIVYVVPDESTNGWFPLDLTGISIIRFTGYTDERGRWHSGRINFIDYKSKKRMNQVSKGTCCIIMSPWLRGPSETKYVPLNEVFKNV
jgi:phage N-6-adenine-methyltransferase